jgi:para-aminobenzoate synthetase component 1
MLVNDSFFWMDGLLATELITVSNDLNSLNDDGFWVVSTTFEGASICAKFGNIFEVAPFPEQAPWHLIETHWKSSLGREEYEKYVEEIRSQIFLGNVYQVNACRVLTTYCNASSIAPLFAKILEENPSHLAAFLRLPEIEIASASPELFLRREGTSILTSPMKGTRAYGADSGFGVKDSSENLMIVDLMRNDLGRICKIGSVNTTALMREEEHPGLIQLVSDVRGELLEGITWEEIITPLHPPGSVSGAPKIASLKIISTLEPVLRENYCGVFGWVQGEQGLLNVAIRTFWLKDSALSYGTGAGITWGSDPKDEWQETELKTANLLRIAGGFSETGWPFDSGIFETIRVEAGKALLLDKHLERAYRSAAELGIDMPDESWLREEFLPRHINGRYKIGRLRLTFGQQIGANFEEYREESKPLRLRTLMNDGVAGFGIHKSYPYTRNLTILEEARSEGFDEVLSVGSHGEIGEGAISNFAFLVGDEWITPRTNSEILPGVVRSVAIAAGLIREGDLSLEELKNSSGLLTEVRSVVALSSMKICIGVSQIDDRFYDIGEEVSSLVTSLRKITQSNSVG